MEERVPRRTVRRAGGGTDRGEGKRGRRPGGAGIVTDRLTKTFHDRSRGSVTAAGHLRLLPPRRGVRSCGSTGGGRRPPSACRPRLPPRRLGAGRRARRGPEPIAVRRSILSGNTGLYARLTPGDAAVLRGSSAWRRRSRASRGARPPGDPRPRRCAVSASHRHARRPHRPGHPPRPPVLILDEPTLPPTSWSPGHGPVHRRVPPAGKCVIFHEYPQRGAEALTDRRDPRRDGPRGRSLEELWRGLEALPEDVFISLVGA
jgi:hypothetical protein